MDQFRKDIQAAMTPAITPPTTGQTIYRVQVGAFSVKANADRMLMQVKETGIKDAFIVEGTV